MVSEVVSERYVMEAMLSPIKENQNGTEFSNKYISVLEIYSLS